MDVLSTYTASGRLLNNSATCGGCFGSPHFCETNIFTHSATSGGYSRPIRASSGNFHSTPTSADFFVVVPPSLADTVLTGAINRRASS
ncbi:hypothetical protein Hanom_Chr17g01570741 [Helianthus anomalus]